MRTAGLAGGQAVAASEVVVVGVVELEAIELEVIEVKVVELASMVPPELQVQALQRECTMPGTVPSELQRPAVPELSPQKPFRNALPQWSVWDV